MERKARYIDWPAQLAFGLGHPMRVLINHIRYPWHQHRVLLPGYAATRGSIGDPAALRRAPK
jgi:hypothetical protein